jgi:hypothetical protein
MRQLKQHKQNSSNDKVGPPAAAAAALRTTLLGLLLFSSIPAHFSSMDSVIELGNDQSSVFSSYFKENGGGGGGRACVKYFGFLTCKKILKYIGTCLQKH